MDYSRTLSVLLFAGINVVILFRVAKPLTTFKTILCLSMFGIIVLAFITPIGRYIFSFTKLSFRHWVEALAIIILSGPIITKFVDIFRVRINKKFKVKTN